MKKKMVKRVIVILAAVMMLSTVLPVGAKEKEKWEQELIKGKTTVVSTVPTFNNSGILLAGILESPMATANAAAGITEQEVKTTKQCPVITIEDSQCGPKAVEALDAKAKELGAILNLKLDMTMYVQNSYPTEKVTAFAMPLQFCYAIPEGVYNEAAKNKCEIMMLHIENGTVKVLTDLDDISNTITFQADSTGLFVFAYAPQAALDAYRPQKAQ